MFLYRLYDNRIVISKNNSSRTYNGGTVDKEPVRQDEKEKRKEKREKQQITKEKKERKSTYRLNKKKLKDRACAMSKLRQSRKFLAFYSISFPEHMSTTDIYKSFNLWLTNMRKKHGLTTYLWVSEYQSNGTCHYHLLTNNFMKIKDVNLSMAKTLDYLGFLDGRETTYTNRKTMQTVKGKLTIENYNGVDVQSVKGDKRKVIGYMTKYMTKDNNYEYERQPWHCSRNVASLATSVGLTEDEFKKLYEDIENKNCVPFVYVNEYCTVLYINQKIDSNNWYLPPNEFFKNLKQVNQKRYDELTN